jgi:hypothetical protein
MQEFEQEEEFEAPDELTSLKARADQLGMSYHPSIKLEKLRDKINAKLEGEAEESDEPAVAAVPKDETQSALRLRKRKEASELVRIRVTCMNPAKKEWDGEIIMAGNSAIGTLKKYVLFNAEDGWHVPRIIYNQLVERKCQIFVAGKDSRGYKTRQGKIIREFAIEILPQLTAAELRELAQRQAMAQAID